VDAFAATRLAVGAGFLLVAAGSDVRTRTVRDPIWVALGSIGLLLLAVQLVVQPVVQPFDGGAWALLGSAALLFFAIFFGAPLFEEDGFHPRPFRIGLFLVAGGLFLYPIASHSAAGVAMPQSLLELYSMPLMVLVYQWFYRVRILHGGADTKALIALSLLVPTYPDVSPYPLIRPDSRLDTLWRTAFPFSLEVWVDAAVLFLAIPVAFLLLNMARGDFALPQALLGYRARLQAFPPHVWLMEKINDRGEHVLVLFPRRGGNPEGDVARLRAAGIDRAWVTPQIPFMVPLLGGFLLAFFVGNVLLGILRLGG
jgi:preflagellin peptidase FlaK